MKNAPCYSHLISGVARHSALRSKTLSFEPMRYLLYTLPAIGDLVVTLPVQQCILENDTSAQVFWLVRPEFAPILDNIPGVSGVLGRLPDSDLEQLLGDVRPDVLLNYNYRDREIIPTAKKLGVPVRVANVNNLSTCGQ